MYTILINDIHNILLMEDINTFLINSLKLYDILIDSREKFNYLMKKKFNIPIVFNEDKNTLESLITKKDEKSEDIVIDSSEEDDDLEVVMIYLLISHMIFPMTMISKMIFPMMVLKKLKKET